MPLSVKNINKISLAMVVVLLATTIISTVLRVYQLLNLIDARYGFYIQNNFWTIALSVVLILGVALFAVLFHLKKRTQQQDLELKSKVCGAVSILFCTAFVINTANILIENVFSMSITKFTMIELLLSVGCTVAFIVLSAKFFGVNVKSTLEYSYFFLIVWSIYETITIFVSFTSISGVSENMLDLFVRLSVMIFATSLVRNFFGLQTKKSSYILFVSAFLSATIGITTMLSRYMAYFVYNRPESAALTQPSFVYLMWGIFAIAFLINDLKQKQTTICQEAE